MYFPPEPGGASTAAWNRATILYKIGFSVFILCGFPSYPTGKVSDSKYSGKLFVVETIENFTLIRCRLLPLQSSGYLRRFFLLMNFVLLSLLYMPRITRITGRIDVVYSIAPIIFSSFLGYIYSILTKSFFIYEVSDLWPEELIVFNTRLYFIIFLIGKVVAKLSYVFPDMIVTISELASEHVSKTYNPRAPIYVLPIGVDLSKFPTKSKESARKELVKHNILPDDFQNRFIILYSGLISKATRVENLAYVADKLHEDNKEILFLIVGEGEEKQKLVELKSTLKLDNLQLLPFQPRIFMSSIISAADVCVVSLPSAPIFDVDVPTKFYEYLACYKPQIGICSGDLAKIINSNKIGSTVIDGDINRLKETIITFKNSPSLMHSMQENSRTTLQEYTLDNLASKFNNDLKREIMRE